MPFLPRVANRSAALVLLVGSLLSANAFAQSPLGTLVNGEPMRVDEVDLVRSLHNATRRDLANGVIPDDGTDGTWPSASRMPAVRWNDTLADIAQTYANDCLYAHNPDRSDDYLERTGISAYVGENIAVGFTTQTGAPRPGQITSSYRLWADEHEVGHYQNNFVPDVGHFTQIIWDDSVEVGCGLAECQDDPFYAFFLVCNYLPGGNYNSQYPYDVGPACSDCGDGEVCDDGLCVIPSEEDAGTPDDDAGTPDDDAGTPDDDAGTPEPDAGTPEEDAGTPDDDAGTPDDDAGTPDEDAGTPDEDAGTPGEDAGTPDDDAGTPDEDAGTPEPDAEPDNEPDAEPDVAPEDDAGVPTPEGEPDAEPDSEPESETACTCVQAPATNWPLALALFPLGLALFRRRRQR